MNTTKHSFLATPLARGALLTSLSFSLLACGGDREEVDVAQEEAQLVVDSFDELNAIPLEFGPAIAVSEGAFAAGNPTPEGINAALAGLLQTLNPCLEAVTDGTAMTITWGIRDICEPGIIAGESKLTVAINGDQVTLEVTDTIPLTLNLGGVTGMSFAEKMTMVIDPATKSAVIDRSITAIRGLGADAAQLSIQETGDIVLDNTAIPFITFNLDRDVTFNGITRKQTLIDLAFQVKVRLPLSGEVRLAGVEEGDVALVFTNDLAGLATIDATVTKRKEASFAFTIDSAQDDLVVLAE